MENTPPPPPPPAPVRVEDMIQNPMDPAAWPANSPERRPAQAEASQPGPSRVDPFDAPLMPRAVFALGTPPPPPPADLAQRVEEMVNASTAPTEDTPESPPAQERGLSQAQVDGEWRARRRRASGDSNDTDRVRVRQRLIISGSTANRQVEFVDLVPSPTPRSPTLAQRRRRFRNRPGTPYPRPHRRIDESYE